eukprot:UN05333
MLSYIRMGLVKFRGQNYQFLFQILYCIVSLGLLMSWLYPGKTYRYVRMMSRWWMLYRCCLFQAVHRYLLK